MRHQGQPEMRRQNVAMLSMWQQARQLTRLIAGYRDSILDIDRQRKQSRLTDGERGMLDEQRSNLEETIAAFEDRLSAVQGLINLGRSHAIRVH
jgi:hypothetical protein